MLLAARLVPHLMSVSLVLTLVAQPAATVAHLRTPRPIKDVLLPTSTVSGALLAGVMVASAAGGAADGQPWLAVPGAAAQGSLCVTVQSADGRYRADKIEYDVPAAPAGERVVLPFEKEIQHASYVAGLDRDQVAVLAVPRSCKDDTPVDTHRAAVWREARGAIARRLRVAVITGGRDTKMTWEAKGAPGPPKGEVVCREIKGTAFDAWCEADLPALPSSDLQVVVTSYRLNGRPLDPTRFAVSLGR
jgi:hypothetical protein